MEIRPILSAMTRNRTGSALVAAQIAITLTVVVNCTFMAVKRLEFIARPSGMDIDNIIVVRSFGFGGDYAHDASIAKDLETLRALPGVRAVTPSWNIPMSGGGSAMGRRASLDEDAPTFNANYYRVDEHAFAALGVKLLEGRNFRPEEIMRSDAENYSQTPPTIIVTKALADRAFPGKSALGEYLYDGLNEGSEIVGIIEHMYGAWVDWDDFDKVVWLPQRPPAPSASYLIRAEPGRRDELMPVVETTLERTNRQRLLRTNSLEEIVANSYEADRATAVLLVTAIVLLLTITCLGIVGLASFTVRQRTKQIGTRRAIGARRIDIIRYFLIENWLMTSIGIALGTGLAIGLNYLLATQFDVQRLDYGYLVGGMLALWILGFAAVANPARRAAKISPAIATRTV
ncbi:MAG: FtsX-like permease family protein [Pseudomonadota bacterium]